MMNEEEEQEQASKYRTEFTKIFILHLTWNCLIWLFSIAYLFFGVDTVKINNLTILIAFITQIGLYYFINYHYNPKHTA
jgi:hypothetical protein